MVTSIVRAAIRDRERAREFFEGLTPSQRWELGDALVLEGGRSHLMECYELPRTLLTRAFMDELDNVRMRWEMMSRDEAGG